MEREGDDRPRPPRVERPRPAETPSEDREAPERLAELEAEVRGLRYQLGLQQGRLELTEGAESTIREERDRLIRELEEDRRELEEVRTERRRLQEELEEAHRPWWRKMFGG